MGYEIKADINKETFMLLDKIRFQRCSRSLPGYRCIIFATAKNSEVQHTEILGEQFELLKKQVINNNEAFNKRTGQQQKVVREIGDKQRDLRDNILRSMEELVQGQTLHLKEEVKM